MNFLKTINKLIEGLLWLYLPLVLFYWIITPVSFSPVLALRGYLAVIIEPLIIALDNNFNFSFFYADEDISYTPLVLAGLVVLAAIATIVNAKILDVIEEIAIKFKIKIDQKTLQSKKEKEKQNFQEELARNKTIFLALKVIKVQKHEEYLVKSDDGPFSAGLIESYQTSIVSLAKKFSGKEYTKFEASPDVYNFIFTDEERFLQYLKYLDRRIKEINKGTAELNNVFNYEIACSCGYSMVTAEKDFALTGSMLKLCAHDETLITDTLKNKLQAFNDKFNLKFHPKGLYILNEQNVEVHKLKINE